VLSLRFRRIGSSHPRAWSPDRRAGNQAGSLCREQRGDRVQPRIVRIGRRPAAKAVADPQLAGLVAQTDLIRGPAGAPMPETRG